MLSPELGSRHEAVRVHEAFRRRGNEAVRGVRDFTRLAQYQFARFEILCCYTICYYESVPGSQ